MAGATKYDLFISYHSADERWVADLARVLTDNQLSVFFAPEAIRAGTQTARELDKAIRDSAAAIVVVSTATADSVWVELEVGLLLHLLTTRHITTIIPVVRDLGARMPPMLDSVTRIQLQVAATPAEAARCVLGALRTGARPNGQEGTVPETAADDAPPVAFASPELEAVSIGVDGTALEFLVLPQRGRKVALARTPFTEGHLAAIHSDADVCATYAGSALPLTTVSIEDMDEVCRRLRGKTGRHMRLPTSSEWLCAYRAGATTRYFHGEAARLRNAVALLLPDRLPVRTFLQKIEPHQAATLRTNQGTLQVRQRKLGLLERIPLVKKAQADDISWDVVLSDPPQVDRPVLTIKESDLALMSCIAKVLETDVASLPMASSPLQQRILELAIEVPLSGAQYIHACKRLSDEFAVAFELIDVQALEHDIDVDDAIRADAFRLNLDSEAEDLRIDMTLEEFFERMSGDDRRPTS